jgi:hypothetical protein
MFLSNKEEEYAPAGMNMFTSSLLFTSQQPVHGRLQGYMNFPDESVCLMANNI